MSADGANPCREDWERVGRAMAGAELVERNGPMERRIGFEVGYDHLAFPEACGGGGHGRHGMGLRFTLAGPAGAVYWLMNMPQWLPGNTGRSLGDVPAVPGGVSAVVPVTAPGLADARPYMRGHHSPRPLWSDPDDPPEPSACHLLPGGACYSDGSSLDAIPVLDAFLAHGPMAVWAALARYYQELFGERPALAARLELEAGDGR